MASAARKITDHYKGDWHGSYGTLPAPGHSKTDRGVTVKDADDGHGVVFNSFNGADWRQLKDECRRIGLLPERDQVDGQVWQTTGQYDYVDADGVVAYRTVRKEKPGERKRFVAQRPDGKGGWTNGMGDAERVLYRLPDIKAAIGRAAREDQTLPTIYLVEGERKADKLASWGFTAAAVAFGCKGWRKAYAAELAGCTVAILPDNDDEGRAFAERAAADISTAGGHAIIVELPGLPAKGDIIDWSGTADDLSALVDAAARSEELKARFPEIIVEPGKLHTMASEAEAALIAAAAPFYIRGGIVRPVIDEMPAAHGRRTKAARLAEVDADTILDHLSRDATWIKFNIRKGGYVPTDPPAPVAKTILSRDGEWRFRRLAGVITTPTMRPDGSILMEPGYDEATQLLLLGAPAMPTIPAHPTRSEALSALALLDGLLDEFPFVDDASRSVALSGLITPVVRGAMQVSPLHAISAPVAGSGKSFVVDIGSIIATGQRAPVIAAGRTEEETEKRLASALLSGQPIVSIDNVNGQLGGDMLCQMIERPVVKVRPLGVSKLVTIESRATTFATGNNIQLVGDMTRRVILCSLDPNAERPELRQFKSDPSATVLCDRGRYIAAALTIARAYASAGYPDTLPALASFEEWSRLVRSSLAWLGRADPLETMEKARAEDPQLDALRALLGTWHSALVGESKTAAEVKARADTTDSFGNHINDQFRIALLEVADDGRAGISPRRLGRYLLNNQGRIVDGLKIVGADDAHAKVRRWRVVRP